MELVVDCLFVYGVCSCFWYRNSIFDLFWVVL